MIRILTCFISALSLYCTAYSQCTPSAPSGTAGISPAWQDLPCVERGVANSESIYFENFTTITAGSFSVVVTNLTIDSINNLPSGITYSVNPSNSFSFGATGCIDFSGTTNAPAGDYLLEIIITVTLDVGGTPLDIGPMEAKALVAQLESFAGASTGIDFTYYLTVINPGAVCPNSTSVNCTSFTPTGNPGLTPPPHSFPCAEQGVFFDEIIGFENFTTVGPGFTVDSLRLDSLTNLPCNLNWATNMPENTFGPGETGCINITGTTNDAAGQYKLGIWITMHVQLIGTISGEIDDLYNALLGFGANPYGYWIRVRQPGFACTLLDTSSSALNLTASCSGSSVDVQSIQLSQGWNMISSYINPANPSMMDVISSISGSILLIKDGAGNVTVPSLGINNIGNWDVTKGYKIRAASNVTLTISGQQVDPSQTPVIVAPGWSIISYLRTSPMNATTAFSTINSNLLLAKDGQGNTYIPSLGINAIGNLQPGQGYKVRMSSGATLVYPGN